MPLRVQIKLNAKLILRKNWWKAGILLLVIFLLCVALSALETCLAEFLNIQFPSLPEQMTASQLAAFEKASVRFTAKMLPLSGLFTVLTFLLVTPLLMGMLEWYWRLTDNKPVGIGDVFSWYGSAQLYGKSLWLFFYLFLRLLPWLLVCFVFPYALALFGFYLSDGPNALLSMLAHLMFGVGMLLTVCGFFLMIYAVSRYFAAPFLLAEDRKRGARSCVKGSLEATKEQRGPIFVFMLSFLGWFLLLFLCMLAFNLFAIVPAFYVVPYFFASCAVYAKYLIYSGRAKKRRAQAEPAPIRETMQFPAQKPPAPKP